MIGHTSSSQGFIPAATEPRTENPQAIFSLRVALFGAVILPHFALYLSLAKHQPNYSSLELIILFGTNSMTTSFDRRNTAQATQLWSNTGLFCSVWLKGGWHQHALLEEPAAAHFALGEAEIQAPKGSPNFGVLDLLGCLQQQMLSSGLCQNQPVSPSDCRLTASRNQEEDMQKSLHFQKVPALLFCRSHHVSNPASRGALQKVGAMRVPGDGSGSKWQWFESGTGKSQTGLLSCHTTKPVMI